jgi:hypothetical protein
MEHATVKSRGRAGFGRLCSVRKMCYCNELVTVLKTGLVNNSCKAAGVAEGGRQFLEQP